MLIKYDYDENWDDNPGKGNAFCQSFWLLLEFIRRVNVFPIDFIN
jgi:hypothetical protein